MTECYRDLIDKILTQIISTQKIDLKSIAVLALFCEILKSKVTDTNTVASIMLKF